MKCFLLFLALAVGSQAFNCYVGDASSSASTLCAVSEDVTANSCVGPTFTDYTGFQTPAVKYQCGANTDEGVCVVASDDSAATGCKECTGTADCNKPVETTTFKCQVYTYTDKWGATDTPQDCIILKAEEEAKTNCNKPKTAETAQADYTNTGAAVCGKCADDTNCANYKPKMFDCAIWSYDETTKKWNDTADKISCGPIESTEDGKCNQPEDVNGAGTGGYDNSNPCGACGTDAKNCKTVSGTAMATLSVLLLTLTALLHFY